MKAILTAAVLLSAASVASGQSTIYGLDFRMDRFYTSNTGGFVAGFTAIGAPNAESLFAMDFDASATTLWAIHNSTNMYGTVDLTTGVFTPLGPVTGGSVGATGLTASVDGTTWYLSEFDGANTNLYRGDVTTGSFTFVGVIIAGIVIDISIDSNDNLYGNVINDDSLYSINTTTGAGTLIGPTGQPTNFAQGMDFDWSNDVLYATLYTGGGTGVFASIDLTTGFATVLDVTTPLNAEMEMAVQEPGSASGPFGMNDPVCASLQQANSSGGLATLSLSGTGDGLDPISASVSDGVLAPGPGTMGGQFGYYVMGPGILGVPFVPPGSGGFVCVGPTQERFNRAPDMLFQFDTAGDSQQLIVGGANILPADGSFAGVGAIMSGQTRCFQAWHRDVGGGFGNSNFSQAVCHTFN